METRRKTLLLITIFAALVTVGHSAVWAEDSEPKIMTAVRTQDSPKIDGKLDDACWKLAIPTSDFIQIDPDEGKPATEQTIVRVLYDDNNLYFGIECLDSQPDKIISRLVPRESNFWPGDLLEIALDTFHDRQNCYGFTVNPRGVQRDFRADKDGAVHWGRVDFAWDGLWFSAGQITEKGWIAELAIPFKTLRFSREEKQLWGINVHRYQGSKREDSNWSFISRDEDSLRKVSKAGHLVGLQGIKPGLHIEVLPYGTTKYEKEADRWEGDTGLSFKYGITSDFTLDATINPDFCHIEADEEKINLTRFELLYEEKRPFFLERRELFNPMNLFYSRRIADPRFGAKLTGKLGSWSLGLLSAVDNEQGPDPSYGVFRLQKDIFQNSSVGIIGVAKQKTDDQWNRTLGMDIGLRSGQNSLTMNLAKSFTPGVKKDNWKTELELRRSGDRFWGGGNFSDIQSEFYVDQIGYVPHDPHVGERVISGWVGGSFYPHQFGIRQVMLRQSGSGTKRTDDPKWGWHWENLWLKIQQENYNGIDFWHENWYLRWQQQGYRGETFGLSYSIEGKSFVRYMEMGTEIEDHYDWIDNYFGKVRQIFLWADTRPRDNLSVDVNGNIVWEYFPSGKLDEIRKVANLRLTYFPTRDLFLRVFLPINPTAEEYAFNFLFSWAYRPMSRFYVAYNEQRSEDMKLMDRVVMAKISYLWNL